MTTVLEQVAAVAQSFGIPEYIWKPIMTLESGGDPTSRAVTQFEDSRGLFQINTYAHPQYDAQKLYDPVYNATVAFRDFIGPAWDQIKTNPGLTPGEQAAYVWKNGIRPAWTEDKNQQIQQLATAAAGSSSQAGNWLGVGSVSDFFLRLFGLPSSTPTTTGDTYNWTPSPAYQSFVDQVKASGGWGKWIADHLVTAILLAIGIVLLVMTLKSMFLGGETVVVEGGSHD